MATKRKASALAPEAEEPIDPADELMFLCLGGGNEVGRSCHIIQYKGKTVMLDAGMHAGYEGLAALPFYDDFDLSTVDVLLISHFHVDHAASLPYVLAKTNFRGRVFMTHPTKAIYKWLIQDSVRVGNARGKPSSQVYSETDHLSTFTKIEAIDYHTTHTISSIRITPYPAGHVLGAAMFLIEIAGLKIFFTGDYSREDDRHLVSAEVPKGVEIDVLITESTYGISAHVPRFEREQALMRAITNVLNRGGRALLPVFALGRAQELLLILDEYWERHPEFQKIPIYYASNLAQKCMLIYQTYIGAMNENIKRLFREGMSEVEASSNPQAKRGPWDFRYIRSLKSLDRFDDVGSCVMLASPGMFQSGISRELLERWAPSDKNGVIITGYSVEGTMARQLMQEPEQIEARSRSAAGTRRITEGDQDKPMIPRRCSIQEFSFAAHVDGVENKDFIEEIAAPVVILVHGEQHNMMRLKSKLLSLNADKAIKVKVFSPRNCEELRVPFRGDKMAKVMGRLASIPPPLPSASGEDVGQLISGVLVQNDFKLSLVAPEDLKEYAGLTTTTLTCRQHMSISAAGVDLIKWALESAFGKVEELPESKPKKEANGEVHLNGSTEEADEELPTHHTAAYLVMGCVIVRYKDDGQIELQWEGNILNDGIADSIMEMLFNTESSPAAVKQTSSKHNHNHNHTPSPSHDRVSGNSHHADLISNVRLERLFILLEAQFGSEALTPISVPRLPSTTSSTPAVPKEDSNDNEMDLSASDSQKEELEKEELKRLYRLGIPVPGVEVRADKSVARVWLEDLVVESGNRGLGDRVRTLVERATEVGAPLWGD